MKNNHVQPSDLINWCALSLVLTGKNNSLRNGRVNKKYKVQLDYILRFSKDWIDNKGVMDVSVITEPEINSEDSEL